MRKAIAMLIVLAMGVSLWADGSPDRPSKSQTEVRLPDHIQPSGRTETWTLYMADSYGDGWNGASVDLYVSTVLVLDDATVTAGEGDAAIAEFEVDDFDHISTTWSEGSFDGECAYGIYDASGILVAAAGAGWDAYTLEHTVDLSGINILSNSGFEGGFVEWGSYPGQSFDVLTTGDDMYNSDETFTAYDGDKSFKMWGLYWGNENMENNNLERMFF